MKTNHANRTTAKPSRSLPGGSVLVAMTLALGAAAAWSEPEGEPRGENPSAAATALLPVEAAALPAATAQRGRRGERPWFRSRGPYNEERAFRSGFAALLGSRAASVLELTEEQRDRLREAMREIADERHENRRRIGDAERAFRRASRDRERPAEEVRALGEALGRKRADAALQRRTDRDRISALLTEEQRARLAELRAEAPERWRRARSRWQARRG